MTNYKNMNDAELIQAAVCLIKQYTDEAKVNKSKAWSIPLPQGEMAREQVEVGLERMGLGLEDYDESDMALEALHQSPEFQTLEPILRERGFLIHPGTGQIWQTYSKDFRPVQSIRPYMPGPVRKPLTTYVVYLPKNKDEPHLHLRVEGMGSAKDAAENFANLYDFLEHDLMIARGCWTLNVIVVGPGGQEQRFAVTGIVEPQYFATPIKPDQEFPITVEPCGFCSAISPAIQTMTSQHCEDCDRPICAAHTNTVQISGPVDAEDIGLGDYYEGYLCPECSV